MNRRAAAFLQIALIAAVLLPTAVRGQQHQLGTFSLSDGLPQSQIWDIHRDSRGFMWFATYGGGVARFDGVNFETFSTDDGLLSNTVYKIHESDDGALWFATRTGVNRMFGNTIEAVGGLESEPKVFDIASDASGRIWAATEVGAFVLRGDTFRPEGPVQQIPALSLLNDANGELWLGTSGRGVFRMIRSTWMHVDNASGLPSNTVLALLQSRSGDVWMGTDAGAVRWDGQSYHTIDRSHGLPNERVTALLEDQAGTIWMGTDVGVATYDGLAVAPLRSRALESVPVWSLGTDHESNVYIGTSGKGVFFYHPSPFTHMDDLARFDGKTVWNISQGPNGDYWFGLEGGVKRYRAGSMEPLPFDDTNFHSRSVRAVTPDTDGNLWFGTSRGVFRRTNGQLVEILDDAGSRVTNVRAIRQGPSGTIRVATLETGAYVYNDGVLARVRDLTEADVFDVLETTDGSVWYVGGHGVSVITEHGLTVITEDDGLANNQVVTAKEDRFGRVWLGTYGGGVSVVHEPIDPAVELCIDTIDTDQGLTDDKVLFMALGPTGNLWVGTNRGLNQIDTASFDKTGKARIQRYGQFEGFIGIEGTLHAAYRDSEDAMWFGHVAGVSRLAPDAVQTEAAAPTTLLTDIRLFMERPDWSQEGYAALDARGFPENLTLPAGRNHVTFDFVGLSFRAAERVRFRHMLEGFDEDWSPPHVERLATYSNLLPGSYTFRVQSSADGITWSDESVGYSLTILPPFWQRWWFVLGLVVGVLALIGGVFELRTRTLKRQQKSLEATVSERTAALIEAREDALQALQVKGQFLANMSHEIRTPMNGVLGFASLLAETKLDKEQAEYVQVIQSSGDSLLTIINDILDYSKIEAGKTAIDANPFSVRQIVERVLDLLSAQASEKGIELISDIAPELPEALVGDETRLQQVLVNLVANAVKFTQEGEVRLSVGAAGMSDGEAQVAFVVRDTGIGIPSNRLSSLFAPFTQADTSTTRRFGGTGLGLAISDRLCSLMGGELTVESELGHGSAFQFTLPMPIERLEQVPEPSREGIFSGYRGLVVTGNGSLAQSLITQLSFWGIKADLRAHVSDAAELLRSGAQYEFVLADLDLSGSDQLEALARCPESGNVLNPMIFLRPVGKRFTAPECSDSVTKPIKRRSLFDAIKTARGQTVTSPVSSQVEAARAAGQLKLLVAEDHPTNRMLISRMLLRMGHDAHVVNNGKEALQAAQEERYDAILMDVQMPVMDGLEATTKIREALGEARPRIIALTAAVLDEDRERCLPAGMDAILPKPLSVEELTRELMAGRSAVQPARDREAAPRQGGASVTGMSSNKKTP